MYFVYFVYFCVLLLRLVKKFCSVQKSNFWLNLQTAAMRVLFLWTITRFRVSLAWAAASCESVYLLMSSWINLFGSDSFHLQFYFWGFVALTVTLSVIGWFLSTPWWRSHVACVIYSEETSVLKLTQKLLMRNPLKSRFYPFKQCYRPLQTPESLKWTNCKHQQVPVLTSGREKKQLLQKHSGLVSNC